MTIQRQNPAYRPTSLAPLSETVDMGGSGEKAGASRPLRRIYAIADTHLGAAVGKTMDRFGEHWVGHAERIRENCQRLVGPEDVLLLPGDLSWALKRPEAEPDLAFLASLPGIK